MNDQHDPAKHGLSSGSRRGRGCMKPNDDVFFKATEVDILNEVLDIVPELKVCAEAVRLHRARKLSYPIVDHDALFDLFEGQHLAIANHQIDRNLIGRYVHAGLFPIVDDQALMRVVYMALGACNTDLSWALQAPPHAYQLLRDVRNDLTIKKGEI